MKCLRAIVISLVLLASGFCGAETVDLFRGMHCDRFMPVEGTSNAVAQAEQTLRAMSKALHPRLASGMTSDDVCRSLQWILHVSLPGATNDAAYFASYGKALPSCTFDHNLLTNRAARLTRVPSSVRLKLLFDDGARWDVSRAVPGVDFPGVTEEDSGSTAHHIRIKLFAPKADRHFRVIAETERDGEYEFKWVTLSGRGSAPDWTLKRISKSSERRDVRFNRRHMKGNGNLLMAVFARTKGGLWGVPSYIEVQDGNVGVVEYGTKNEVLSVDYGGFKDYYIHDDQYRICGFTRVTPDNIRGRAYSTRGELVEESYSDGRPKVTREVSYSCRDGRLEFHLGEKTFSHKNEPIEHRSPRW